ncbi:MAG: hypothetical protein MJZ20_04715 [Bacteroidaceae bacterium]|nr:hypothetical protein [Bacteroidaceae bacterium]
MADVTVLMVGGRRCGKSSILASMESMLVDNPELSKYIKIRPKGKHDLHVKKNNLETFITKKQRGAYYLVDFDASDNFNVYTFEVSHPNAWFQDFTIDFVDCPGETFGDNPRQDLVDQLTKWKAKANIFLIVVDTPFLMEGASGEFKNVSFTMNIAQLFDDISGNSNNDFRKIIFVPIKCEKWKNGLNEVATKLQKYYDEMFENRLPSWKNFSYGILPVLTAGGIEFGEFSDPQLLAINGCFDHKTSCCKKQGNSPIIRMYDGSTHVSRPGSGETIVKNTEFTDINPGFPKYSWFKNNGVYSPKNCDQIAYQVVRFALFYMLAHHSAWRIFAPSKSDLKKMIQNLETHFLKDDDTANGIIQFATNEKMWHTM